MEQLKKMLTDFLISESQIKNINLYRNAHEIAERFIRVKDAELKIFLQPDVSGQLPLSVLEDKIQHFIKYNRKICWEAEMEDGEFCIGENRLLNFVRELKR